MYSHPGNLAVAEGKPLPIACRPNKGKISVGADGSQRWMSSSSAAQFLIRRQPPRGIFSDKEIYFIDA